ncbi:MAG: hydroxymethylbilane synthase [Cytophagales bacterium]|nr:hydroxymethylbilane synthase [Cytophagales bacterium]
MPKTIKIGTRGSKLALWQASYVADKLKAGGLNTEIITIETKGDKILNKTIAKIGNKGVFTEELEEKLKDGKIDIAVHSAKDMLSGLDDELEIIAFTEREMVNDVLVSYDKSISLQDRTRNITIGTSAVRRIAMLKHYFPHVRIINIRGNLQTRFEKLENGHCDALILAYAGVHRMGYKDYIVEKLPDDTFTPAVGQGALAIEAARSLDYDTRQTIKAFTNHAETEYCLIAERSFLKTIEGGCSVPVFALAKLSDNYLTISGGIISLDGKELIKEQTSGSIKNCEETGKMLANKVLGKGGGRIIEEIKRFVN